jgi:hypothetical protein
MIASATQRQGDGLPRAPVNGRPAGSLSPFRPGRFSDRGVVLPATTPAFAFARVRDGAQGPELVLRNATGTRGALLIPLSAAADYARPTLHDRALFADILRLPRIGPAQVAAIARAAARAGLAGRAALAAACAAAEAEAREAQEALAALGGSDRQDALRLAPLAAAARRLALLPPQLRALAVTAEACAARASGERGELAGFIAASARATARFGDALLAPLLAALDDPATAAAAAASDPSWPSPALSRAAWVLDGWPLLLRRWEAAEEQRQLAGSRTLQAIASALPPLPAELAATAEEEEAVRATWRPEAQAVQGAHDQALLERLRAAAP